MMSMKVGLVLSLGVASMIVASAIRYKGVIFTGVRHYEIIKDIHTLNNSNVEKKLMKQGFIDHLNRFYTRSEAKEVVIKCGQKYNPISTTLTSEDLW